MSKTGKPRRSFTSYVNEQAADPIEITDDDGDVILTIPKPQFWSPLAKQLGQAEQIAEMFREVAGADAFDAFAAGFPYDPEVVGQNLVKFLEQELGGSVGESSASSTS